MSIQNASIAGTQRAATRGGTIDNQSSQLSQSQSIATNPAGKSADSNAIDAGDQTGDRRGDGRQALDTFERNDEISDSKLTVKPMTTADVEVGKRIDYKA